MNTQLQKALCVPREALTTQQREIVRLIAESHTQKQIAGLLNVKHKTVQDNSRKICRLLGLRRLNIAILTRWAAARFLIDVKPDPGALSYSHLHD